MAKTRKTSNKKSLETNSFPKSEEVQESSTPNAKSALTEISNQITEQDILSSNNPEELLKLINSLTNNKQDEIFSKFKQKTNLQLKQDSQIIKQLNEELHEKQGVIDNLLKEIRESKSKKMDTPMKSISENTFESPIRKKKVSNGTNLISEDQLSKELENIGITFDMLELLTGLRIVNYREDETKFYFDIKQNSTYNNQISIEYKLIISKNFESTAEINYIPTFLEVNENDSSDDNQELQERIENCKILKEILPEYLCDNLSFPYNTLSQFYNKVNRALNKARHE